MQPGVVGEAMGGKLLLELGVAAPRLGHAAPSQGRSGPQKQGVDPPRVALAALDGDAVGVRRLGAAAEGGGAIPFSLNPDPEPVRPRRRERGYVPLDAKLGDRPAGVEVVYISPLKALAADIQQNLEKPLVEIEEVARGMGLPVPEVRVGMRSGDTPASARAAMRFARNA